MLGFRVVLGLWVMLGSNGCVQSCPVSKSVTLSEATLHSIINQHATWLSVYHPLVVNDGRDGNHIFHQKLALPDASHQQLLHAQQHVSKYSGAAFVNVQWCSMCKSTMVQHF